MRQWKWLELVKDYDYEIHYHPSKANRVIDALSRKESVVLMSIEMLLQKMQKEIIELEIEFITSGLSNLMV